mmetsp:Transcript_32722/g.87846  ORF Transcript_32722/g.87846 Transcript_32722/m.87846 type:complete len:295 (+) Transcript_32722:923-1807(+)
MFARIFDDSVSRHTSRKTVDDRHWKLTPRTVVHGFNRKSVTPVWIVSAANNLQISDVGAKPAIGQDAIFLGRVLKMLQDSFLFRPNLPLRIWKTTAEPRARKIRSPPHMKRSELCLQFGGLVRGRDPAITPNPVVAVETDDVRVLFLEVMHARFDSVVTSADDANGVRILVWLCLEALDTPDGHTSTHLVRVLHLPESAPTLLDKLNHVHVAEHQRVCQRLLYVAHTRARLQGKYQSLIRAVDGQRGVAETRAVLFPCGSRKLPTWVEHVESHLHHLCHLATICGAPFPQFRCW